MTNTFESLGLHPDILRAVTELGYETPTPIQEQAIPVLLSGRDVLGQAQTGTGKTAAFALPMLEKIEPGVRGVQGLVLAPTRELAMQVAEATYQYGKHRGIRVLAIYGGSSYSRQLKRLDEGVQVVVGTPGRVIDLIERGALKLQNVRYMVLDEADEMLKMGFIEDVETILKQTPPTRQTALFSATLAEPIRRLAEKYMHSPETVSIAPKVLTVPQTTQRYFLIDEDYKLAVLSRLLETEDVDSALIFARTKVGAAKLAEALIARGYPVEALHGDLSQEMRETVMRRFRKGHIRLLVATDVAARGLDIQNVSHVINFDMPSDAEDYVHRIGRTGRAGREGVAVSLVTPRERRWLRTIEQFTGRRLDRGIVPTVGEVVARRDERFKSIVEETLGDQEDDFTPEVAVINNLIESGYDLSQVAAAAVRLARSSEAQRPIEEVLEPADRMERPYRRDGGRERGGRFRDGEGARTGERRNMRVDRTGREPGMVRLLLDAGRADGIQPGDVVGAIASAAGIPGRAIGAIDIHRNETYVDVKEAHVDRVLRQMGTGRGTLRGRPVTVRRA